MIRIGKLLDTCVCPLCRNAYLVDRSEAHQTKIKNEEYDPEDPDDYEYYWRVEFFCPECDKYVYRMGSDTACRTEIYTDSQLQWFKDNNKQYDESRVSIAYKEK